VPPVARLLQMLLVAVQRSGETAKMKWSDLELPSDWQTSLNLAGGWWTIPGTETKNGRTHRVWLTATAMSLLREAKAAAPDSKWVFASQTQTAANVGARSKKAMASLRRMNAIDFDATRHDLRRTGVVGMRAAGVTRAIVEMVVNHAGAGGPISHYDHYEGAEEKRTALTKWEQRLTAILAADGSKKVVPFAR